MNTAERVRTALALGQYEKIASEGPLYKACVIASGDTHGWSGGRALSRMINAVTGDKPETALASILLPRIRSVESASEGDLQVRDALLGLEIVLEALASEIAEETLRSVLNLPNQVTVKARIEGFVENSWDDDYQCERVASVYDCKKCKQLAFDALASRGK